MKKQTQIQLRHYVRRRYPTAIITVTQRILDGVQQIRGRSGPSRVEEIAVLQEALTNVRRILRR